MSVATPALRVTSEHGCCGGVQGYYEHDSAECATPMRFAVYRPPQAATGPVPVLWYLAGLTCSEETFPIKAGAQRLAAEYGIALVAPDTSPRQARLPGDDAGWDFGLAAGFYVDATVAPWSAHYRLYGWITRELPALVAAHFPVRTDRQGIFGHSMGGHGALVCALRNPGQYRSVSALAPIAAPMRCPWGERAFTGYLGADRTAWAAYDASELVRRRPFGDEIRVDQGLADKFLAGQLKPELFVAACREAGQPLDYRAHAGYDHGYYFVQTFVPDHLAFHARRLTDSGGKTGDR
jgi:S-formylglutathione hydrolase